MRMSFKIIVYFLAMWIYSHQLYAFKSCNIVFQNQALNRALYAVDFNRATVEQQVYLYDIMQKQPENSSVYTWAANRILLSQQNRIKKAVTDFLSARGMRGEGLSSDLSQELNAYLLNKIKYSSWNPNLNKGIWGYLKLDIYKLLDASLLGMTKSYDLTQNPLRLIAVGLIAEQRKVHVDKGLPEQIFFPNVDKINNSLPSSFTKDSKKSVLVPMLNNILAKDMLIDSMLREPGHSDFDPYTIEKNGFEVPSESVVVAERVHQAFELLLENLESIPGSGMRGKTREQYIDLLRDISIELYLQQGDSVKSTELAKKHDTTTKQVSNLLLKIKAELQIYLLSAAPVEP